MLWSVKATGVPWITGSEVVSSSASGGGKQARVAGHHGCVHLHHAALDQIGQEIVDGTAPVGSVLTLAGLDLQFNDISRFYEAPFQMKANGGLFLIDDFGRQQARPRDLLNRWIVPLENRVDFLTLANGRKIEIPFEVLVVFSTNLPPKDLVDEAFLRRIRHKIEIVDPSPDEYREIMRRVCEAKHVAYDDRGLAYLIQEWYIKRNRKLRANHPRDLTEQIIDVASFLGVDAALTKDLIDRGAESYFVEL